MGEPLEAQHSIGGEKGLAQGSLGSIVAGCSEWGSQACCLEEVGRPMWAAEGALPLGFLLACHSASSLRTDSWEDLPCQSLRVSKCKQLFIYLKKNIDLGRNPRMLNGGSLGVCPGAAQVVYTQGPRLKIALPWMLEEAPS